MDTSFVCEKCWAVLDVAQATQARCGKCKAPAPPGGFAPMPFWYKQRFLFHEQLGRGGQGAVFRASYFAEEGEAPHEVAVKVVRTVASATPADPEHARRLAANNDEALRRFDLESRAAGMFGASPYFVDVRAFERGARPHLVMELVQWPTLGGFVDERRRQQALSPTEVASLGVALLAGVAVMHAHSVIHRDLKPSNLFVNNECGAWRVKIADLGIWTRSDDQEQGIEASLNLHAPGEPHRRQPLGTPEWMSPEQQSGEALGPPSDLYAVGEILWWALAGRVPFPSDKELFNAFKNALSEEERMFAFEQYCAERLQRMRAPPPRPDTVPETLYAVLARALAFEPNGRYQRASEFREALDQFIAGEAARSRAALEEAHRRVAGLHNAVSDMGVRLRAFETLAQARQDLGRDVASLEADLQNPAALDLRVFLARITAAEHEVSSTQSRIRQEITSSLPPAAPSAPQTPLVPAARTVLSRWVSIVVGLVVGVSVVLGLWLMRATNSASAAPSTSTTSLALGSPDAAVDRSAAFRRELARSNPWLPVPSEGVDLQQHEVSRREYLAWLRTLEAEAHRPWAPSSDADASDDTPVTSVTPVEARSFCEALGAHLPREATWDALLVNWPRDTPALMESTWPHSVKLPIAADVAPSGHRDLLSNVSEWVSTTGSVSLRRGGSFRLRGDYVVDVARHASSHEAPPATLRLAYTGFRCERPTDASRLR